MGASMNFEEFQELIERGFEEIVLDSDLKISPKTSNLEYKYEISSNNIVIDGKGHSIDGLNKWGIFIISGKNVTLKNLVFKNFFGTAITNIGHLNIEDCIFKDTSDNKYEIDSRNESYLFPPNLVNGSVYNIDGEINIRNCLFKEENSKNYNFSDFFPTIATIINSDGKVNIENSTFTNDDFPAIDNENNEVNIDSCEFKGEFADIIHTKSKINISNSQFEKHHVLYENGEFKFLNQNHSYDCLTFNDLNELMDSNLNEISFDKDIYSNKDIYHKHCILQKKYYDPENPGIDIRKNDLIIDGNGKTIYGYGTHGIRINSDNLILRNINFIAVHIECEGSGNIQFENCSFGGKTDNAIVNYANLKLDNCKFNGRIDNAIVNYANLKLNECQFEKHHKIIDHGNLDFESCDNLIIYRYFDYLMKLVRNSIADSSYEVNLDCNIIFNISDSTNDITLPNISKKECLASDDSNIAINGNGHCIFKDSPQNINLEADNIVFKNINLINEGSYLFEVNNSLSFENSNIRGFNFKNNGSIDFKNCIIDKSTFYNVSGGIKFYDCKFEGYVAKDMIFAETGLIDLIKCSFENISLKNNYELENMGKIIQNENASVNIRHSSFRNINNIIVHNINGKLNIENTCFNNIQNKTFHDKPLYTIYNNGKTLIKSSIFEDNFMDDYNRVIYNDGILEIENSKIIGDNEEIILNRNKISIKNLEIEEHSKIITTDNIRISDDKTSKLSIKDNQIVKIKDTNYLNNLISNGDEKISLKNYFYADSITITRDNITIDGCGNTIDADFKGNIFNIEGENITLKNIHFINTSNSKLGGIHNIDKNLTIENCIFENNKSSKSGCGISNESGHVKIENALFKNNGCFYCLLDGGAIYNNEGKIDLNHCNFLENKQSRSGGAISNAKGEIFLHNCNFIENMSGNNGGAIYNKKGMVTILTSDFKQNKTQYYGYTTDNNGGAIYNEKGEILIEDCDFEDNTAGGIGDDIYNNRLMEIKNTNFNGHIGEIIYNNDSLKMESCKINSPHHIFNHGTLIYDKSDLKHFITKNYGKAFLKIESNSNNKDFIYLDSIINNPDRRDKIIKLTHDIALNSEEKELYHSGIEINADDIIIDGQNHYIDANLLGSIFIIKNKNIVLRNIKFRGSYSNEYGALNVKDSTLKLENCSFIKNSSINGSCIKDERSNIKITNCKFSDSYAPHGGAIYCSESKLKLENCKFICNSAHDGGAIYCSESELKLENSNLEKNSAKMGGSIYFKNSTLDIINCKFDDNLAYNSGGGAIAQGHGYKNSTLNIHKSIFSNNQGYSVDILNLSVNLKTIISDSFFENYKANEIFGAIRFDRNSDNILKNCNFNYKSETVITNQSHLVLVNCNLEKQNIARQKAIFLENEDELYKFRNLNNANLSLYENYHIFDEELDGAGLHIDGNMHKIIGNLKITGKNIFLKNIVFTDNIIIETNDSITFENCSFNSNADEVIINHSKLTLKNCNFKEEHRILNTGEVTLIQDRLKEVHMEEIIKINPSEDLKGFASLFD